MLTQFFPRKWKAPLVLGMLMSSMPAVAQINLPLPNQATGPAYHPTIGSSKEVTADPHVPRPTTIPCVVPLFTKQLFADFSNKPFTYTPPANCPGPWAKVVLVGDFYIQKGVQYDRTAEIFLNNVNIFYGTTPEPLGTANNAWNFERDLSDYGSLFRSPQTGQTILGNLIEPGLNSAIIGTAYLQFYPADLLNPPSAPADAVLPLPDNANGAFSIGTSSPQLSATFTLPTNVERAYMDVIAESQNAEEQWFTCVPNDIASELFDCGDSSYREVEVMIDGTAAGLAPVSPWIYTGGLDPYLWIPLPGVQTLNFVPYRVDLTPFAAVLSDGKQHTVSLEVYNAYSYFNVTGALLLYTDHGLKQVTGAVTQNTLTAPHPTVNENITTNDPTTGAFVGTITTDSARSSKISGFVNTSHGKIVTTVEQTVNYHNGENIKSSATSYIQNTYQSSSVETAVKVADGFLFGEEDTKWSFPITVLETELVNPDNTITIGTTVDQLYGKDVTDMLEGFIVYQSRLTNEVKPTDTFLLIPVSGGYAAGGNSGQKSSQSYFSKDTFGNCYSRSITAANNAVTGFTDGVGCK